ncbi:MAG: alpha/beta hydrolase fold domain-containing protein [Aequorivita sp.]
MRNLLIIVLILGIQFSYVSCSKDSENISEIRVEAETFLDVSYGSNPQEKYDLYLPADRSTTKTKVIALVHGGGWTDGDKDYMAFLIPYIKQKHPDYAIVNINYVLADENTPAFPNQILNLGAVINKLTNEKEELQVLPEFALIGVSAGAQLSLMYDYVYDTDNQVKLVADIVGPTDFTDSFYTGDPDFPTLMTLLVNESAYPPGTDYAEVLSPALQVSTGSSPTLLFYGNADPLVPLSNATTLNTALNSALIDHNFNVYEGGHGTWATNDIEDMLAQISDYIDTYLEIEE